MILPTEGIERLTDSARYATIAAAATPSACLLTAAEAGGATAAVNLPEDVIATGIIDVAAKSVGNLER